MVDDDAIEKISLLLPRLLLQDAARGEIAAFPSRVDACTAEIDVAVEVFIAQARRYKSHEVHARGATVGGELLHRRIFASTFRKPACQLSDHVSQSVDLFLAKQVAARAARVQDFLVPAKHLPDRFGFRAGRIPELNGKDRRAAARFIIEHGLDRRVRVDPAIPIRLAVDDHRRERGGSAPEARMCRISSGPSRVSK